MYYKLGMYVVQLTVMCCQHLRDLSVRQQNWPGLP